MTVAKKALTAHRDLCRQLNWQIKQREGWIRNYCSFFCFVGPADSFFSPPQRKPIAESLKPETSYAVSHSNTPNVAPSHQPPTSSKDGLGDSPREFAGAFSSVVHGAQSGMTFPEAPEKEFQGVSSAAI